MLNKSVLERLGKLEKIILTESAVPLVNRLLGDATSEKLTNTWMYKSWGDLTHSDLVEKGDALHYRRVLKKAREETFYDIKRYLDKNVYAEMIMELIMQVHQEQMSMNQLDALYLMELTLDLAKTHKGVPVQTGLLNMMHSNREEYGSLALLKLSERPKERCKRQMFEELEVMTSATVEEKDELPLPIVDLDATLNSGAALSHKQDHLDVMRGDMSHLQKLTHTFEDQGMTDSQLINSGEMLDEVKKHDEIEKMAQDIKEGGSSSQRNGKLMLIDKWEAMEYDIRLKVSGMLNDSVRMKDLKTQLWERQQYAEKILDYTEECCEDDDTKGKYHREMMKMRPVFRGEMGKKIAARPEVADKIYNVLDAMMEREVSAFEYMNLAVALARNPYDIAVTIIECDMANNGGIYSNVNDVLKTLEGFDERCKGMSTIAAKALSERQDKLWEYAGN